MLAARTERAGNLIAMDAGGVDFQVAWPRPSSVGCRISIVNRQWEARPSQRSSGQFGATGRSSTLPATATLHPPVEISDRDSEDVPADPGRRD